ncbi:unnamed protein product [Effrenium voratum]|uniref:3-hydroxyisobutyryl-CoA hydrolase n=1 Tax=Effrenium voratum TaxID=2562239 RepID=A0AA36NDV2_9DINO|nr:unnamed protein product [Effrenium voratum]
MEARRLNSLQIAQKRRFRFVIKAQLVALALCWAMLVWVLIELKDAPAELRTFDPYQILGVERGAGAREIKKAYHTKSLQHHPDKDKDNPLAPVLFQQVSKAYEALTDESARKNYEKYGNPDGPVQMKMGIALHPSLLVKENQIFTLCCFFAVLFVVPFSVVCCCLRGSNVSAAGISGETLKVFHACIDMEVSTNDTPGLLAATLEARRQMCADIRPVLDAMVSSHPEPLQPGIVVQFVQATGSGEEPGRRGVLRQMGPDGRCEVEVWPPSGPPQKPEEVQTKIFPRSVLASSEPRIPCSFSDNLVRRGAAMLWAHMRRLHPHMTPMLQAELTNRLMQTPKLCRAMISIAAHGEGDRSGFIDVVRSCIMLSRCLVQAIDFNDSPLLQLPHVKSVPKAAPTLREVVESVEPSLKRLGNFTPQQVLDIQSFCRHVPLVELSYVAEVNDEPDMAEGDMGTIKVTLTRTNLAESECVGPVHAPFFPAVKFEEWWLLVYDNRGRRLIASDLMLGTGRETKTSVNFIVPRPGDFDWTIFAMCDSYAGLDAKCDVSFRAAKRTEVDRSIFVHPEDAEIRTFFEEVMLGLDQDQESSEEEEEDDSRQKQLQKREAKKSDVEGKVVEAAEVEESEAVKEANVDAVKEKANAEGSDEDEEEKAVPEGSFFRIKDTTGTYLYREPVEDESVRMGSVPPDTVLRGFQGDGRPDGWLEVPTGRIKFSADCAACHITLNRPAKLNALNLSMIRCLHGSLDQVDAKAGKVGCLIVDGAGGRAFCAGGDVQMIREEGMAGGSLPADFFYEEYGVIFRLATLFQRIGCCQVSLCDGITMGGGVGLATHGPFRVVTEKTRFAMPEMAIGLFPDVGATYLLSHLKAGASVGRFLGMTGTTLAAWDCLRAGVGTHFVPSARLPRLRKALMTRFSPGLPGDLAMKLCEETIKEFAEEPSPADCVLDDDNLELVERCFSAASVEEIVQRLRAEKGDFAAACLMKLFQSCSPTSCKVTLAAMNEASKPEAAIGPVLRMEYRLSQRFTTRHQPASDFFEGIRAVLVDKDRMQKWNPSWEALHQITAEHVAAFFAPLEPEHTRGELPVEDLWDFSESRRPPFPEVLLKSKL